MKPIRCIMAFLLAAFVASTKAAFAQDDPKWSITPYLWATDTTVDLTFRDANIGSGDITFSDLLDVLDTAFMVQIERGAGNWSAFADITYLATSEITERNLVTIAADSKQNFVDAAVAYWPAGYGTQFNVYGGVRYTGFDDRYRIFLGGNELATQRSNSDYYDVLVGLRYQLPLSDRWALVTRGDLSAGDSEGTYLLRANFAWSVGKRQQNVILFGYQLKSAEYKDGDVTTDFDYKGPTAGFSFRF